MSSEVGEHYMNCSASLLGLFDFLNKVYIGDGDDRFALLNSVRIKQGCTVARFSCYAEIITDVIHNSIRGVEHLIICTSSLKRYDETYREIRSQYDHYKGLAVGIVVTRN